jgi:hypothetical protein
MSCNSLPNVNLKISIAQPIYGIDLKPVGSRTTL